MKPKKNGNVIAQDVAKVRALDEEAQALREKLGWSRPGECIWKGDVDFNRVVVVEADGYGGAVVQQIREGNYPVDYNIEHSRKFPLDPKNPEIESLACEFASLVLNGKKQFIREADSESAARRFCKKKYLDKNGEPIWDPEDIGECVICGSECEPDGSGAVVCKNGENEEHKTHL